MLVRSGQRTRRPRRRVERGRARRHRSATRWSRRSTTTPRSTRCSTQHGADIAAVIVEPVPANYGLLPQRDASGSHASPSAAAQRGALLDPRRGDQRIPRRPRRHGRAPRHAPGPRDCYGKVIGGGFPVAAYAGRADLMELVAPVGPVYQAGTLSANPVGMRAGLATLREDGAAAMAGACSNERDDAVLRPRFAQDCRAGRRCRSSRSARVDLLAAADARPRRVRRVDATSRSAGRVVSAVLPRRAAARRLPAAVAAFEVCFLSMAHDEETLRDRRVEALVRARPSRPAQP